MTKVKLYARAAGLVVGICMVGIATAAPVTTATAVCDSQLSAELHHVLRGKGTERAFSGKYNKETAKGTYECAGCGHELFTSETKFDSGTGWPSFFEPIAGQVKTKADSSHGMTRTEVVCGNCSGHLGHVFNDGPKPTGKRYCINSVALNLKKSE